MSVPKTDRSVGIHVGIHVGITSVRSTDMANE